MYNKISIVVYFNEKNKLVVLIKEDEKIKVVSDVLTGSMVWYDDTIVKAKELSTDIPFLIYSIPVIINIANDFKYIYNDINKFTNLCENLMAVEKEINKYKKLNNYYTFDLRK